MSILKKNMIILALLDISYMIISLDIIWSYYLEDTAAWYAYIPFAVILLIGMVGLFIYRKMRQDLLPITTLEHTLTRVLMFAFLIIYVVQMIIIPDYQDYPATLPILMSSFLAALGLVSLVLHSYILWRGHRK